MLKYLKNKKGEVFIDLVFMSLVFILSILAFCLLFNIFKLFYTNALKPTQQTQSTQIEQNLIVK